MNESDAMIVASIIADTRFSDVKLIDIESSISALSEKNAHYQATDDNFAKNFFYKSSLLESMSKSQIILRERHPEIAKLIDSDDFRKISDIKEKSAYLRAAFREMFAAPRINQPKR